MTRHFTSGTNTAANASAYQVTGGEWASGTIQWSNKPAANTLLQSNISHNNVTGYVFSCLTAVQHWYDGDTTGQNQNYGIMLCYQDPEIADYNSFYSADCTDATMRPSIAISYKFNQYYSTYGDAEYYRNSVYPYGIVDDGLQFRANCYGYALRFAYDDDLFKSSLYYSDGDYFAYKQMPGEFANKTYGLPVFYHSQIVDTLYTNFSLRFFYQDYILNETVSSSFRMHYLIQLIRADLDALGCGLFEHTGTSIYDASYGNNTRLIAVVVTDKDFHFYVQHSDNTWSHKPGANAPKNCCFDCDIPLTNENIREHACEGNYKNAELAFLYVSKDAIIDGCHADGTEAGCFNTEIYSSEKAGNHLRSALEWGVLPKDISSAKIDYVGDVDCYAFIAEVNQSYQFNATMTDGTTLIAKLYDRDGLLLHTQTSTAGQIDFEFALQGGEYYFISIETSGQVYHKKDKTYQISIY